MNFTHTWHEKSSPYFANPEQTFPLPPMFRGPPTLKAPPTPPAAYFELITAGRDAIPTTPNRTPLRTGWARQAYGPDDFTTGRHVAERLSPTEVGGIRVERLVADGDEHPETGKTGGAAHIQAVFDRCPPDLQRKLLLNRSWGGHGLHLHFDVLCPNGPTYRIGTIRNANGHEIGQLSTGQDDYVMAALPHTVIAGSYQTMQPLTPDEAAWLLHELRITRGAVKAAVGGTPATTTPTPPIQINVDTVQALIANADCMVRRGTDLYMGINRAHPAQLRAFGKPWDDTSDQRWARLTALYRTGATDEEIVAYAIAYCAWGGSHARTADDIRDDAHRILPKLHTDPTPRHISPYSLRRCEAALRRYKRAGGVCHAKPGRPPKNPAAQLQALYAQQPESRHWPIPQVADHFGVTHRTIQRWKHAVQGVTKIEGGAAGGGAVDVSQTEAAVNLCHPSGAAPQADVLQINDALDRTHSVTGVTGNPRDSVTGGQGTETACVLSETPRATVDAPPLRQRLANGVTARQLYALLMKKYRGLPARQRLPRLIREARRMVPELHAQQWIALHRQAIERAQQRKIQAVEKFMLRIARMLPSMLRRELRKWENAQTNPERVAAAPVFGLYAALCGLEIDRRMAAGTWQRATRRGTSTTPAPRSDAVVHRPPRHDPPQAVPPTPTQLPLLPDVAPPVPLPMPKQPTPPIATPTPTPTPTRAAPPPVATAGSLIANLKALKALRDGSVAL